MGITIIITNTYVNYLTVLLQRSNEIIYVGVYGTNGQYTNQDSVLIRIMLVKLSSGFWQNVRQGRFVVNTAHLPAFQFPGSTYNPAAFVLPLRKECCLKRHLKVLKKQEVFHIYLHF